MHKMCMKTLMHTENNEMFYLKLQLRQFLRISFYLNSTSKIKFEWQLFILFAMLIQIQLI